MRFPNRTGSYVEPPDRSYRAKPVRLGNRTYRAWGIMVSFYPKIDAYGATRKRTYRIGQMGIIPLKFTTMVTIVLHILKVGNERKSNRNGIIRS